MGLIFLGPPSQGFSHHFVYQKKSELQRSRVFVMQKRVWLQVPESSPVWSDFFLAPKNLPKTDLFYGLKFDTQTEALGKHVFFVLSFSGGPNLFFYNTSSDMSNKNGTVVRPMVDHLVLHSSQAKYILVCASSSNEKTLCTCGQYSTSLPHFIRRTIKVIWVGFLKRSTSTPHSPVPNLWTKDP